MVPAEVLAGAVAMFADASSQAEHLLHELVTRELIEFWSGRVIERVSRHQTTVERLTRR